MTEPAIRDTDFAWVDDYIAHVGPRFELREEDSLLILMPNKAVKLNPTGLAILGYLKDGGSMADILRRLGDDQRRRGEVFYFLCDVRSLISGCLGEGRDRKAVHVVPHEGSLNVLPVLSEVALTYRCNLQCRFCYAACNCRRPHDPGDEMTTEHIVEIFKIIRHHAKVPSVSFTGGEPLLRDDIVSLTRQAVRTGLRVNLITNGVRLADGDLAGRLLDAGLSSAQVSLEGSSPEVHERLTGVSGSFEKTLAGLAALRKAGMHVHTNTTICRDNADDLVDLVRLVVDLGIGRLSMNMIIPTGTAAGGDLRITYGEIGDLVSTVREACRQAGIEFMWYSPTPMCLFNPLAEGLGNKSCAACDGLLSVSPAGDVLPCSSFAEPVGNLLRDRFETVWHGARAVFLRDKRYAPNECTNCGDLAACAGACPLYWSAMGTAELADAGRVDHALA